MNGFCCRFEWPNGFLRRSTKIDEFELIYANPIKQPPSTFKGIMFKKSRIPLRFTQKNIQNIVEKPEYPCDLPKKTIQKTLEKTRIPLRFTQKTIQKTLEKTRIPLRFTQHDIQHIQKTHIFPSPKDAKTLFLHPFPPIISGSKPEKLGPCSVQCYVD